MNTQNTFLAEATGWFLERFQYDRTRPRLIGLEKEYPVVDSLTFAVADVRPVLEVLSRRARWTPLIERQRDGAEVLTGVTHRGVVVTTDAGHCTLELAGPPRSSIIDALTVLHEVEQVVVELCTEAGLTVLGYGIQPVSRASGEYWIQKERHAVIRRVLPDAINAITITASDQCHVDVAADEVVMATRVFNALSWLYIVLFANSPVHGGRVDLDGRHAVREDAWLPVGSERSGIIQRMMTEEELVAFYLDLPFLVVRMGDGEYINPHSSFQEWVAKYEQVWPEMFSQHEGAVWLSARPRTAYGTIEVRPACSQRGVGSAQVAALTLGIAEQLPSITELIDCHSWQVWELARQYAILGRAHSALISFGERVIDLARQGLAQRGLGEEAFLIPLTSRLRVPSRRPAHEVLCAFRAGGVAQLVDLVKIR